MCGIFAYTGRLGRDASEILLEGLTSLEYRGYDSAGIFTPESGAVRAPGAVDALRTKIPDGYTGTSGIAHLRWATHGEPTERNAHPHSDCNGDIWLIHNGIIENYRELKVSLIEKGHTFASDSDTEVLAHLIEEHLKNEKDFEQAVFATLNEVRGTYGLAIQYKKDPSKIIGARMGSPLALGVGDGEYFIASDASPILKHTKKIIFLEDGEVVVMTPGGHSIHKLDATKVERAHQEIDWNAEEAQKGGYEHFMLKEIMEGPEVVENTTRGRILIESGKVRLGGLESVAERLRQIDRIIIVACGTAAYAGMVGEYMLESEAHIPVEVEIGSEFRYKHPVINAQTAVLAITQSGETLDTLEAVREGKRRGALTLGIVNTCRIDYHTRD